MKLFLKSLTLYLSILAGSANAALPLAIEGQPLPSLAPMLETIQGAVVNISTTTSISSNEHPLMQDPFFKRFFNFPEQQQRRSNSLGSGVIINAKKGYVITNHHVIDKADEITVTTSDGRVLTASLVGSDPDSDVAIIKVDGDNLNAISLGKSSELRVGDFVVAIGSPFGLSQTVTSGIVSALGRSGLGIEGYEDFIQTDADINPGNSGGALVNLRGELIGINTAIFSRGGGSVGIGFAIPIDMVNSITDQLVKHGNIQRGLLGVAMQDLTPSLADAFGISGEKGAVVSQVIPNSAAEEAGIKEGDVIIRFNDLVVDSGADLRNAVGLLRAGEKAKVTFYRDAKKHTVSTRIKEMNAILSSSNQEGIIERLQGARFSTEPATAERDSGVVVSEIIADSPASASGLKNGDIILSVNRVRVTSVKEMREVITNSSQILLVNLIRENRAMFLVIE